MKVIRCPAPCALPALMEPCMISEFDHERCPSCDRPMRLALVEPHELYRDDQYEHHIYVCENCANTSRFVFELPSRRAA
jgi:hypothetical protein